MIKQKELHNTWGSFCFISFSPFQFIKKGSNGNIGEYNDRMEFLVGKGKNRIKLNFQGHDKFLYVFVFYS